MDIGAWDFTDMLPEQVLIQEAADREKIVVRERNNTKLSIEVSRNPFLDDFEFSLGQGRIVLGRGLYEMVTKHKESEE